MLRLKANSKAAPGTTREGLSSVDTKILRAYNALLWRSIDLEWEEARYLSVTTVLRRTLNGLGFRCRWAGRLSAGARAKEPPTSSALGFRQSLSVGGLSDLPVANPTMTLYNK